MPELAITILTLVAKYGPTFVSEVIAVCHKTSPTLADWNAAFDLAKNPIAQVSDMPNKP